MTFDEEQEFVAAAKFYVSNNLELNRLSDEDLEEEIEKGWDGNQDGVMEGSQHNTMDVNYFGPNPQMGFWYMGALKAAEKMSIAMKDKSFAKKCRTLFEKGSKWMDENHYLRRVAIRDIFSLYIPFARLQPDCSLCLLQKVGEMP